MIIDDQTFAAIGKYEGIEGTIVEDVALTEEVVADGVQIHIKATRDSLALTLPCQDFNELIHQRARWLRALARMPWFVYMAAFLRMAFVPAVLVLSLINPWFI